MKTLLDIRTLGVKVTTETTPEELAALAKRVPQLAKKLEKIANNGKATKATK